MSGFHKLGGTDGPITPVLLKMKDPIDWPADDSVFYLLAKSGLFLALDDLPCDHMSRPEAGPCTEVDRELRELGREIREEIREGVRIEIRNARDEVRRIRREVRRRN